MHYAFSAAPSVLIYILTGIPALRPGLATGGPSGLLLVSISSFEAGSEVPGYSRCVPGGTQLGRPSRPYILHSKDSAGFIDGMPLRILWSQYTLNLLLTRP
jgi:hypothetical protein